jgi:hypothetical protein
LSGLCSDCEATAMVVKRKTRNKSNTHHTPTVPRVQPLLKCAPSCHVRGVPFGGRSAGGHPLNVACSWTAPITTESHSSSPISNSPSHRSSSQSPHSLLFEPSGGGWPHTAVKQDCHKVTHTSLVTIRPPASSCHLHRGSNTLLNPFRRAGFAHVHSVVDDIAGSCISRVAAAACAEGGGASGGRTHSVEVQTELRPATPSSHSTPASLQLERMRS